MRKLQKVTSIPVLAALLLVQGIQVAPDIRREEAIEIVNTILQNQYNTDANDADQA